MSATVIHGHLIIDKKRGEIFFHADPAESDKAEGDVTILRITHLRRPVPDDHFIDLAAVDNLLSYTPLAEASCDGYREREPERCKCGRIHPARDKFQWKISGTIPAELIIGHEYEIITLQGRQEKPRYSRLGFLGPTNIKYDDTGTNLEFNGRGPNRSTGHPYCGTVQIGSKTIMDISEVERDESRRYVNRMDNK